MAARLGRSIADPPAAIPASRNSTATGGEPCTAPTTSAADVDSIATCEASSSRRRSSRSASVPPTSDTQTSGISSARPIRPTISDDRVSTYTWKGSATSVTWVPRPDTKPPSTSSR